jgi:hypothetical protein
MGNQSGRTRYFNFIQVYRRTTLRICVSIYRVVAIKGIRSWRGAFNTSKPMVVMHPIVLLPGFQKGSDIKASQGKGQGAVLAKNGQVASYKKKT